MTLQLSHRQQAILEEMGIGLFLKKPSPLRSRAEKAHQRQLGSSQLEHVRLAPSPEHGSQKVAPTPAPTPTSSPSFSSATVAPSPLAPTLKGDLSNNTNPPLGLRNAAPKLSTSAPTPASLSYPLNPEALAKVPQMSWPMLNEHLQQCQACEYGQHATQKFFTTPSHLSTASSADISSPIDWLMVADTPKRSLEGSGIAFSEEGMAFLNIVLKQLGFSTDPHTVSQEAPRHHHISHALKCLSPSSQVPSSLSTQTCLVHLRQEIKLLRPKLLLVMGQSAAQALLHDTPLMNEPLGRLRSKVHQFEMTPMVVTYTPEQMMRSGENKSNAWHDLCLAHSLCE